MKVFEYRACPNCGSTNYEVLVCLKLSSLLKSNPGYNLEWFYKEEFIPLNHSFSFVQCKNCGFVFSKEKLNNELTFKYYNEGIDFQKSIAKIYTWKKRKQLIDLWSKLHSLIQKESPIKVLDFGAGWGDFLAVAKCIGVEVFGLEFDNRKIEFSKKNGIPCGDFSFISKNAPFDVFMCNQVLEHLDNPRGALKEMRSLLRKGAVGFISVPNFPIEIINQQVELIESGRLPSKDFDPLGHLNYFDENSLKLMLEETGFSVIYPNEEKSIRLKLKNSLFGIFVKRQKGIPSFFVKAI